LEYRFDCGKKRGPHSDDFDNEAETRTEELDLHARLKKPPFVNQE